MDNFTDEEVAGGYRIGNTWYEAANDRPIAQDPDRDVSGQKIETAPEVQGSTQKFTIS